MIRLNINLEKMAKEDPLHLLIGNETTYRANGTYGKLIEDEIERYFIENQFKRAGVETCSTGLSEIYNKDGKFVFLDSNSKIKDNDKIMEMKVISESADFIRDINKHIIERINPKVNDYMNIENHDGVC
jgi:hypothetical protein